METNLENTQPGLKLALTNFCYPVVDAVDV